MNRITEAFDAFEEMQEVHRTSARDGLSSLSRDGGETFPDLAAMSSERQAALARLARLLDEVKQWPESHPHRVEAFHLCAARLEKVINNEERLRVLMQECKTALMERLGRLKHGKTALAGYGRSLRR